MARASALPAAALPRRHRREAEAGTSGPCLAARSPVTTEEDRQRPGPRVLRDPDAHLPRKPAGGMLCRLRIEHEAMLADARRIADRDALPALTVERQAGLRREPVVPGRVE